MARMRNRCYVVHELQGDGAKRFTCLTMHEDKFEEVDARPNGGWRLDRVEEHIQLSENINKRTRVYGSLRKHSAALVSDRREGQ